MAGAFLGLVTKCVVKDFKGGPRRCHSLLGTFAEGNWSAPAAGIHTAVPFGLKGSIGSCEVQSSGSSVKG